MNKLKIVVWLFLIFLLQVIVLNNINFAGYINPYLYISFAFILPLRQNRFSVLFFAFIYGLLIDFFSDTGGIHAFSLLSIVYMRIFFIKLYFKKASLDYLLFNLHSEPFGKVFNYVITLTFIHHFILFSLANFSLHNFVGVLLETVYASIFTLILYFLGSYVFRKKQIG